MQEPRLERYDVGSRVKPYQEGGGIAIWHGDCRQVLKAMPADSVDLVVTDPPYGVDWQSNRRNVKLEKIINDDSVDWLEEAFAEVFRVMKPNTLCMSFYGWPQADAFVSAWRRCGFELKSHIVWVKNTFGLGWFTRGQHEQAYLLTKGSPPKPDVAPSDVVVAAGTGNELHPSQKPVGCLAPYITAYSKPGDIILDPFMGSGTTLRAAKELGRRAIGIDIDQRHCDTAINVCAQQVLGF